MPVLEQEPNILIVTEPKSEKSNPVRDFLCSQYDCETADGLHDALDKVLDFGFEIVVADLDAGEDFALEMLYSVRLFSEKAKVILVSGCCSKNEIIRAFRDGAFDFLHKPFGFEELDNAIKRAFTLAQSPDEKLEKLIMENTGHLNHALEDMENSYRATLKALIQALETRDCEIFGHSERVVTFSLRLAHELGLEKDEMRDLELGALLHDIGKIGVPDSVLRKPAKLTEKEWDKMKLHPVHGYKILRNIPFLDGASKVVAQHHEHWDGKGYPNALRGVEIDIIARVFAVADAFDAMISDRIYRKGRSFEDALFELEKYSGTQFDPIVVEAFRNVPKEDWEKLRQRSLEDKTEVFSLKDIVREMVQSQNHFEMIH